MNNERQYRLRRRLLPEFADRLLARGRSRGIIWRNGELPLGAPFFAADLDDELCHYAFSILSGAIDAREAGQRELSESAFAAAAEALESVARDGSTGDSTFGFLAVIGAAAYGLARYNARAYNLLTGSLSNLSSIEVTFQFLLRRDFGSLRSRLLLMGDAENFLEDEAGDAVSHEHAFVTAMTANYNLAVGSLLAFFVSGAATDLAESRRRLDLGVTSTAELRFVEAFWLHKLTRLLIDDFDRYSYHRVLPIPTGASALELRNRFIRRYATAEMAQVDLWPSQLDAAARSFDEDDDLVVSLPTSSGKTRIAELTMLPVLATGRRVIFVTPLRACARRLN